MFRPVFISVCLAACFVFGYARDVRAESYLDKGKKYYAAKDYKNAMHCFQARLKKKPRDPFANYYAALTYQATGDVKRAYECYKTAARYAGRNNISTYSQQAMKRLQPRLGKSTTSFSRKNRRSGNQVKQSFLSNLQEHKLKMEQMNQKLEKSAEKKEK